MPNESQEPNGEVNLTPDLDEQEEEPEQDTSESEEESEEQEEDTSKASKKDEFHGKSREDVISELMETREEKQELKEKVGSDESEEESKEESNSAKKKTAQSLGVEEGDIPSEEELKNMGLKDFAKLILNKSAQMSGGSEQEVEQLVESKLEKRREARKQVEKEIDKVEEEFPQMQDDKFRRAVQNEIKAAKADGDMIDVMEAAKRASEYTNIKTEKQKAKEEKAKNAKVERGSGSNTTKSGDEEAEKISNQLSPTESEGKLGGL